MFIGRASSHIIASAPDTDKSLASFKKTFPAENSYYKLGRAFYGSLENNIFYWLLPKWKGKTLSFD